MKTTQAYYHQGKFWFSEKGWLERKDFGIGVFEDAKFREAEEQVIKEAVEFEDQQELFKLTYFASHLYKKVPTLDHWKTMGLDEGIYIIPDIEVEIVIGDWSATKLKSVARIVPSLPESETQEELWKEVADIVDFTPYNFESMMFEKLKSLFTIQRKQ